MTLHPHFPNVFQPLKVGGLTLKNRIFVPGHTTNFGAENQPTQRHLHYHHTRARGGVALIIFESIRVHRSSLGRAQGVGGYDSQSIKSFGAVTDAVHSEGIPIFGQIIHLGRQVSGEFARAVSWGPSSVRWSPTAAMPHAMNHDDIGEVIDGHVRTANNLVNAGFDGFEVHLGHGHLLQQFLSPSSNCRNDSYGGSEENRRRLPIEVLRAVREAVGPEFCMGVRVSGEEFMEGGFSLAEMCRQIVSIASEVKIDFINTSHSAYHSSYSLATQIADMAFSAKDFDYIPAAIGKALRNQGHVMPIFSVCRYRNLDEAENLLASGQADMVGMARAHLADPDLVRKTETGHRSEVRPCIGCNQGCAGNLEKELPITCLINPRAGLEQTWTEPEESKAVKAKRILVIGGGPAGAQAAWVLAARGHAVDLWEQNHKLGGQLNLIRQVPSRHEFLALLDYQLEQCKRYNVSVLLEKKGTIDSIKENSPDLVVLATGSRPTSVQFPRGGMALTLEAALKNPARLGDRLLFYDTIGEWSTLAAIEHFADLGKTVIVLSPIAAFSWRTTIYSKLANQKRLRDKGVKIMCLRKILGNSNTGVLVEDVSTGEVETITDITSLIAVQYNIPEDQMYQSLRQAGFDVKMVGDALAARTALEAVYEGHEVGMECK